MRHHGMLAIAMLLAGSMVLLGAPLAYACGTGDPGSGSSSSGSSSGGGSSSTGDTPGSDSSGGSSSGDTSGSDSSSGSPGAESKQQPPDQPPPAPGPVGHAAPVAPQDPGGDFVPPAPVVPQDRGGDFVPPQAPAKVAAPPAAASAPALTPAPVVISSGETPTTDFEVRARSGFTLDCGIAISHQTVEVKNLHDGKSRTMSYWGFGIGAGIGLSMVTRSDPVPYSTARPATTADFGGWAGAGGTPSFTHWQDSEGGDLHSNLGPPGNKKAVLPRNSSGAEIALFDATLGRWW